MSESDHDVHGENTSIPLSFFVELFDAFADIKPHGASEKRPRNTRYTDSAAHNTFKRWVDALRKRYSPLPLGTTALVFRLLFPDEDVQRKYGLQETRLAQYLVKILGVSSDTHGRGERLKKWQGEDAMGCLGEEVKLVMSETFAHSQASTTEVTLEEVDALLTELAAKCAFSEASARASSGPAPRRPREAILKTLYTSLSPAQAAIVTQIILKDLRPLLYPIPSDAVHYTAALLRYKSNALSILTREMALRAWDPSGRLGVIYKNRADLKEATRIYDNLRPGDDLPAPQCGTPIQISKCVKGQGTAHALRALKGARRVWVETKYDGERAQIHVQLDSRGAPHIKIYSKSGRESTLDRSGIHNVIYGALGVWPPVSCMPTSTVDDPSFKQDIVVEAELVAFSNTLNRIDEFWRIRSLIASTAVGARHKTPQPAPPSTADAIGSQCSVVSNGSDGGTRHLALVFFDILLLDGVSLLSLPYSERRATLEQAVRVVPGYSMLAERTCVDTTHPDALDTLREAFAKLEADHQEGAVLKADEAQYGEWKMPWVKLKRDYIDGYGDAVDLVLLGASWEKDRARELRVLPTAYTTFYFGALANADALGQDSTSRPHFQIIFTSSYGPSREQLEELNFMIKSSDPVPYRSQMDSRLPYTYTLCPNLAPPTVFLPHPLLAELFGAGFTKAQGSLFYELRFPRISKIYRPSDRPWKDGTTLKEYQTIARTVVGRDRSGKAEDDWAKTIFCPNQVASPGVRCPKKRKQVEMLWVEKLEAADGKVSGRGRSGPAKKKTRLERPEVVRGMLFNDAENDDGDTRREDARDELDVVRPRGGFTRLGSVTNLVATSPTPGARRRSGAGVGAALQLSSPSHSVLSALAQKRCDAPLSVKQDVSDEAPLAMSLPQTPPPTVARNPRPGSQSEDISPSGQCSKLVTTPLSATQPSTLHQFLQDSVVWLARPSGTPRPSWRAPSHAAIPTGSQVHTLDALLLACGWHVTPPCGWAARGVVFVDTSEDGVPATQHALGLLARKRAHLFALDYRHERRPVLVLDTKMLAYEALGSGLKAEEVQASAICIFG
ncbi:hypothetical protein C8Q80DRAFT_1260737 [Daedaleopsis nitida]|nr:hypothetical protein C8Q80DRAFT_1260737 [Daedaleopsis nitida]